MSDYSYPVNIGNPHEITIKEFAEEIIKLKQKINLILAKHTGQPVEKIEKDTDRDFFMSAEEAKEYGVVDKILRKAI